MSKLKKDQLIQIFSQLGQQLALPNDTLTSIIDSEQYHNAWFTPASVSRAVKAISTMLNEDDLTTWLNGYDLEGESSATKKVGLILAGNIPLVGFHDVLCVLTSGHHALIKASTQDARLIKQVLQILIGIEPGFADQFSFIERLTDFDAVIATGSNNTSRYFEYYFGKVPNIIRKNRNSIALLTGNEHAGQLNRLGHDIFDYYGLGCRNVSKLLVPKGYILNHFFESIESYQPIIHHHKYNNNYDYNKSIYLVNRDKHFDNGFLLVKDDKRMVSPLAVLFYEEYEDLQSAEDLLNTEAEKIQCVVTAATPNISSQIVDFGQSQQPALGDYADGVDTMAFLVGL